MVAPRAFRLLIALAATGLAAAPAHASSGPENLTLRLGDLPPGYLVGDDSGCGLYLAGEGSPRALTGMRRHRHRSCMSQFEQLWVSPGTPAGPPLVESDAIRFATDAGAVAAFEVARPLVAYALGLRGGSLVPRPAGVAVGHSTVVFGTDDALVRGRPRRPGAVVVWRSGRVLSLVFAAGQPVPASEQAALALAQVQQARILAPTPLGPRDNDDREVALDNPGLGIAVHWLGRRFRPPGRLPALTMTGSFGPLSRVSGPGWRAELDYEAGRRGARLKLGLWKPRAFARFKRSKLGRLVRGQRCARATRLELPGGRAVIYGGYTSPPRRCAGRLPDRFLAHVFLNGVVVTVNIPFCFCSVRGARGHDPWDTLRGMRAVVENLRPRLPEGAARE
jgi:hypothetical protein